MYTQKKYTYTEKIVYQIALNWLHFKIQKMHITYIPFISTPRALTSAGRTDNPRQMEQPPPLPPPPTSRSEPALLFPATCSLLQRPSVQQGAAPQTAPRCSDTGARCPATCHGGPARGVARGPVTIPRPSAGRQAA